MSIWLERLNKWKKSHIWNTGIPFLSLVIGCSFLLVEFQRIKYNEKRKKTDKKLLESYGIEDKIDMTEELKKVAEANSNHEWINVRGPRVYEDNREFLSLREAQEDNFRRALERANKNVDSAKQEES